MKISVNNKEVETAAVSISALVEELSLPLQGIAVAREPFGAPYRVGRLCVGRGDEHCHHQSGVRRIAFSHSIQ